MPSNITAFLRVGKLEELRRPVDARMRKVLDAPVIDTVSDRNTTDTARRVAKMFVGEVSRSRYEEAPWPRVVLVLRTFAS